MTNLSRESLRGRYYQYALWLAVFTIAYNLLEGAVSAYFGAQDESLTLFGFGLDSFVEVISAIGILFMVLRIRRPLESSRSAAERTALRITGACFYALGVILLLTAIYSLYIGHKPTTAVTGLIISSISIAVMWALVVLKRKVGHALDSEPILSDAQCSLVCIYMSLVLLAASLVYHLTGLGMVDSLGALGLIYFSVNEGRESFKKAEGLE